MPEIKPSTLDGISETLLIPLYYRALEKMCQPGSYLSLTSQQ